jgi:hypothetical protein
MLAQEHQTHIDHGAEPVGPSTASTRTCPGRTPSASTPDEGYQASWMLSWKTAPDRGRDEPAAGVEDGIRTALERLARPPEAGPEEARAEIKP